MATVAGLVGELDRMQRVGESVRVAGEAKVDLVFECGRCLSERVFITSSALASTRWTSDVPSGRSR